MIGTAIILAIGAIIVLSFLFRKAKGHGISLLVPFHCPDQGSHRAKSWRWLEQYWKEQLPGAEIIIGEDPTVWLHPKTPFSKSIAVNDAASKAKGDIFCIVDADGYISADAILHCAMEIREARKQKRKLWFIPYRHFFRLTEEASQLILQSDPSNPYVFSMPPPPEALQRTTGAQQGHWFGAGIQIMPREAFEEVGGWDPRFRGWGGEDHAAMRAMDTLYWRHQTLHQQFLHIWHPMLSPTGAGVWVDWKQRMWENQENAGANDGLSGRYYHAQNDPILMRKLVNEGIEYGRTQLLKWWRTPARPQGSV